MEKFYCTRRRQLRVHPAYDEVQCLLDDWLESEKVDIGQLLRSRSVSGLSQVAERVGASFSDTVDAVDLRTAMQRALPGSEKTPETSCSMMELLRHVKGIFAAENAIRLCENHYSQKDLGLLLARGVGFPGVGDVNKIEAAAICFPGTTNDVLVHDLMEAQRGLGMTGRMPVDVFRDHQYTPLAWTQMLAHIAVHNDQRFAPFAKQLRDHFNAQPDEEHHHAQSRAMNDLCIQYLEGPMQTVVDLENAFYPSTERVKPADRRRFVQSLMTTLPSSICPSALEAVVRRLADEKMVCLPRHIGVYNDTAVGIKTVTRWEKARKLEEGETLC